MHSALEFEVIAKCAYSKARVARLKLPHSPPPVETPVFMPVGTQGTMKGVTSHQLQALDCRIILGNTYHLGLRPGQQLLDQVGGLHTFMNWPRALLTDSGGFQMVSLLALSRVTEEGVEFASPHDGSTMLLTPEKSIELQNSIGADIIMQLDDVVSSLTEGPRVLEAMERSVRWLDRCIGAHSRAHDQCLFAIVQGGLDEGMRVRCVQEMVKRDLPGYAIGGLSGGEDKARFWRMVSVCTDHLPVDRPRYCMGVGYALDLVVCSALGVDMFDCVFPTRTARFGNALTRFGSMNLRHAKYASDCRPIDAECECVACSSVVSSGGGGQRRGYTRAHLHRMAGRDAVAGSLLSIHNIAYQMSLMRQIRESIVEQRFPAFVRQFIADLHSDGSVVPQWAVDALRSVNIDLSPTTT